jgi:DNA polymerase-3 subunit epsilon
MPYLDKITHKLIKSPLKINTLKAILGNSDTFYQNVDLEIELLFANGYPLRFEDDKIYLQTATTKIKNQIFCIVDIEINSSKTNIGQIIEIGAVKYQDGNIIDSYKSLVNANEISSYISDLTNITQDMLRDAPSLKSVMQEFKIFLDDDVFVAHDVKFDYKFISKTMEKLNLGKLFNRKLCTIDLAKRCFFSEKYGLQSLKNHLNIDIKNHHRAYDDALSTTIILEKCLQYLPKDIKTTEDLIKFSKSDSIVKN